MSEPLDSEPLEPEPLPDDLVIYRLMRSKSWVNHDTGDPKSDAFLLRPAPKDQDGLSVCIKDVRSLDEYKGTLTPCHGVLALTVAAVRSFGLNVEADPNLAGHAFIVGLPRVEDSRDEAERVGGKLAAASTIEWLRVPISPPDSDPTE